MSHLHVGLYRLDKHQQQHHFADSFFDHQSKQHFVSVALSKNDSRQHWTFYTEHEELRIRVHNPNRCETQHFCVMFQEATSKQYHCLFPRYVPFLKTVPLSYRQLDAQEVTHIKIPTHLLPSATGRLIVLTHQSHDMQDLLRNLQCNCARHVSFYAFPISLNLGNNNNAAQA